MFGFFQDLTDIRRAGVVPFVQLYPDLIIIDKVVTEFVILGKFFLVFLEKVHNLSPLSFFFLWLVRLLQVCCGSALTAGYFS